MYCVRAYNDLAFSAFALPAGEGEPRLAGVFSPASPRPAGQTVYDDQIPYHDRRTR